MGVFRSPRDCAAAHPTPSHTHSTRDQHRDRDARSFAKHGRRHFLGDSDAIIRAERHFRKVVAAEIAGMELAKQSTARSDARDVSLAAHFAKLPMVNSAVTLATLEIYCLPLGSRIRLLDGSELAGASSELPRAGERSLPPPLERS